MSDREPRNHSSFPSRHHYFALALGFMAFAVYGSLLPFDLQPNAPESAWITFRDAIATWPRRISRTDVLANILLFVPIGFTLAGSVLADRRSRSALALTPFIVLPICLATSVSAEFLQLFAIRRVPSGVDILAQITGSVVGMFLWLLAGSALTTWIRTSHASPLPDRLTRVLVAAVVAWAFINLAPFDFTLDVGDLGRRVRSGHINIIPFASSDASLAKRAWDIFAAAASALPIGMLATRWTARSLPALAFGVLIIGAIEFTQIFISSHAADATDLLAGAVGVMAGIWSARHLFATPASASREPAFIAMPVFALAAIAAVVLMLCAYHWQPYDFVVDPDLIRLKLRGLSLMPFAAYGSGSYLNALNNVLADVALAVPLGIFTALVLDRVRWSESLRMTAVVTGASCLFGALEAGQFFLPTRTPDVTDVLVGVAGVLAGLAIGRLLTRT